MVEIIDAVEGATGSINVVDIVTSQAFRAGIKSINIDNVGGGL